MALTTLIPLIAVAFAIGLVIGRTWQCQEDADAGAAEGGSSGVHGADLRACAAPPQ